MISGVNHVTLVVRDLDEAFEFYANILKLKPLAKRKNKSSYFLAGNDWIALVEGPIDLTSKRSYAHLAFSVSAEEFKSTSQDIINSGAKIWQDNSSPGDSLYFLDPSGNQFEMEAEVWKCTINGGLEAA